MKKVLSYLIPAVLCAAVITLVLVGYFQYEYRMNMAYGIGAPIGVCLCYASFFCAEIVCIRAKKSTAAMVLAIIKFILLFIGTFTVFHHTMLALGFMVMFGLVIPVFLPIAIVGLAMRVLVFVIFIVFYIGIIAEPLIIAFTRTKPEPVAENPVQAEQ